MIEIIVTHLNMFLFVHILLLDEGLFVSGNNCLFTLEMLFGSLGFGCFDALPGIVGGSTKILFGLDGVCI